MSEHLYGMYRGVVTTNADPEGRMRVKARVPQVLGGHETGWAWPCVSPDQYGTTSTGVPRPGQGVWILFEGGDISMPLWVGVWGKAPVTEAAPPAHDDADHADAFAPLAHAHDYPVDSVNGRTGAVIGLAEDSHTHGTAYAAAEHDAAHADVFVAKAGGDTITASGATVVPLVVKGAASQTANLLEARDDAGTVLADVPAAAAANEMYLEVHVGAIGLRRLVVGAVDSAGTGFRTVRIAN